MAGTLDKFCPDLYVSSVADIDVAALKAQGFEALMLDLDNTLLPWNDSAVPESSRQWVEQAARLEMRMCIVSNTHYPKRLNAISEELGVPSVFGALKPRSVGFKRAAAMVETAPERCVAVGDQVMTDILGGNLAGMYTILVKPMHPKEFIGTKISRLIERGILALLRRRGKLGTIPEQKQSERRNTN